MKTTNVLAKQQARFFSNHNLDITSIEKLAQQVAKSLKQNVAYSNFEGTKLITHNKKSNLFLQLYPDYRTPSVFVVEIGEMAILIGSKIIEYDVATFEVYDLLKAKHEKLEQGLASTFYFNVLYNELKALTAGEVLVVKDYPELSGLNNTEQTFEQFKQQVQKYSEYFAIAKQEVMRFL